MSAAFWCDYANHAAKYDENVVTMSSPPKQVTISDQFGQHVGSVPVPEVQICGDCAVLMGLRKDIEPVAPSKRHAAIQATLDAAGSVDSSAGL